MTNKISAKVICDSVNEFGDRMTTLVTMFPRYILAELNTHRAISKNSASSRAKPFKTMLKSVNDNAFIPVQWMKDHKGMQGNEFFKHWAELAHLEGEWLTGRDVAIGQAINLSDAGLTKQIVNRILEPFMWHEVVITATDWDNFFTLRCPRYTIKGDGNEFYQTVNEFFSRKDAISLYPELADYTDLQWRDINKGMADIHIMDLAEAIWDAMNESVPNQLEAGQWHLPYADDIDENELLDVLVDNKLFDYKSFANDKRESPLIEFLLKISAARCARISYKTFGEDSKIDYLADIKLHDALLVSQPIHASPAEHQGQAMSTDDLDNYFSCEAGNVRLGTCRNLTGFIQYRTLLQNETIREDRTHN